MKTKEQLDADTLFAFQMALKGHEQFEFLSLAGDWRKTDSVSSEFSHRIYHDIPEGWTRHDGEDWKGDKDAKFDAAMFCSGRFFESHSNASFWINHCSNNYFSNKKTGDRIYAYKLAEKKPEIPEGFIRNNNAGDNSYCPLSEDARVEYIGKCGTRGEEKAGQLFWYNVIAYRVIEKKVIPWTIEEINLRVGQVVKSTNPTNPCRCVIAQTNGVMLWIGGDMIPRTPEYLMTSFSQLDNSPCGTEVEQ